MDARQEDGAGGMRDERQDGDAGKRPAPAITLVRTASALEIATVGLWRWSHVARQARAANQPARYCQALARLRELRDAAPSRRLAARAARVLQDLGRGRGSAA
ncbi:hypothetical protein [Oceanibacterium hippocampi]|uniref:Uncharacterized protein n=1 Tax=Oceanibacterium hippocampi TaxID=745714 RepID=A0A1Y5U2V3_9PROT|nr:hypothetical protein [Oceanibacterium hippocampi]SLN77525.1 hypothetical protein OCH7691_04442 [Oceanibacterium hippocampi]